ncbi:MAG: uroporphyrinogen-III synthase [archaeon]|nr:uroporphyrinogen-III synthase [archaeon]
MTTVGFTRPRERLEAGYASCKKLGLTGIGAPSLDPIHGKPEAFNRLKELLVSNEAYFVLFASITAVEECVKEFGKENLLILLEGTNVACTGSSTEKALKEMVGRDSDLVPEMYSAECVANEIADEVFEKTVVLVRSAVGDNKAVEILQDAGAYVEDIASYDMVPAAVGPDHERLMDGIASGEVDAMVFTSPLTAKTFYSQMQERFGKEKTDEYLADVYKVAIGKPTSEGMASIGLPADTIPAKSTFDGMLETVAEYFKD